MLLDCLGVHLDLLDRHLHRAFEAAFAEFCGAEHALACERHGGAAPGPARAGVGPGDEVMVPTLTYVATANRALLRRHAGLRRLGPRTGTSTRT